MNQQHSLFFETVVVLDASQAELGARWLGVRGLVGDP